MFDPNDFNQIARYVREQQAMYERAAMACGVNRYLAEFNTQQTATIGLANQLAKNWTPILTIMECWAEDARLVL